MRSPQHWNLSSSTIPALESFQQDSRCQGEIRRIYWRVDRVFEPIGYMCNGCGEFHPDDDAWDADLHVEDYV